MKESSPDDLTDDQGIFIFKRKILVGRMLFIIIKDTVTILFNPVNRIQPAQGRIKLFFSIINGGFVVKPLEGRPAVCHLNNSKVQEEIKRYEKQKLGYK